MKCENLRFEEVEEMRGGGRDGECLQSRFKGDKLPKA